MKVYPSLGTTVVSNQSVNHFGKIVERLGIKIDSNDKKLYFVRLDKEYPLTLDGKTILTDTARLY